MKSTALPMLQLAIANELHLPLDTGGAFEPGVIYAANEARFVASNYSEPLTAYLQGWQDPENLEAMLDRLFPAVDVGRRFEFKRADNAESFLSETDDTRSIGASFKRIEYKGSTVNEKTNNKGLVIRIDHDDILTDTWQQQAITRLRSRLARNEIRRGLALLDAASVNTAVTWSSGTPNPDKNVRDALRAAADISGIRPNRVLFSEDASDKRLDAFEAANTPYAGRAAAMNDADLARKFGVDLVETIKARFQSTLSAKALVQVANTVLTYNAMLSAGKDDPSNVKRFVTPTDAGRWKVYVTPHEKFTDIAVEHYSNIVITSALGIRKLTVT